MNNLIEDSHSLVGLIGYAANHELGHRITLCIRFICKPEKVFKTLEYLIRSRDHLIFQDIYSGLYIPRPVLIPYIAYSVVKAVMGILYFSKKTVQFRIAGRKITEPSTKVTGSGIPPAFELSVVKQQLSHFK